MNRRGFLGAIGVSLGAVAVPAAVIPDRRERLKAMTAIPVERANGKSFIVGVAMETVHAGDLVQIQTHGPARVNVAQ